MAEQVLVGVVAKGILTKLASFSAEEINLAWGLKSELKKLEKKLSLIRAVLNDAEGRREEPVRLWLKNLKSVADAAADVVDEFEYEILRRKVEIQNRMSNKVRDFFSDHNPIAFRFKMAHKLKNINTKLAETVREGNELGLKRQVDPNYNHGENRLIANPFVDGEYCNIVGRDGDVSEIVDMLLNSGNEKNLSIIAIVGMAGLGKTTTAQLVYQNKTVMRHFSERLWVCVSDDFDEIRILNAMLQYHTSGSGAMSVIEPIIKELQKKLKEKKCLLVLDDVWNTDDKKWESLRSSLGAIDTSIGSRILITTRNYKVASIMRSARTHRLACLSENDSWNLFQQRAFASGGAKATPNLVDVGKRIVKRCDGLPLAIKMLGGLLQSKKEEHEWRLIERSEIWARHEGEQTILPSLQLSYDNLPSQHLKQCFAYCSIFPKDFVFERKDLIQRWMAQGFLQPPEGSEFEMEDIGNNHFNILLWNCFFQDAEVDEIGNIIWCKMHDLVHDLAQFISGSQCLTLGSGKVNDELKAAASHITVMCNRDMVPTIPRESARKVRTLILRDVDVLANSLFKCLRILDLQGSYNFKELPTSIGKLKHLRYLDVSRADIRTFPTFICELYNLQTLRFLSCRQLRELPSNLKYLINLRHIYFTYDKYLYGSNLSEQMPIEMRRLTCLQTLPIFFAGQERGRKVEELRFLNKLRGALEILNLQNVGSREEAEGANLVGKMNLYELTFEWSREGDNNNNKINDEDVLEGLQPNPNLKILKIKGFGDVKFPSWVMRMSTSTSLLVEIKLINCKKCEQIPALGQLRFLRVFEIERMDNVKCIGTEFYGDSNNNHGGASEIRDLFPALKTFSLSFMWNLVEWMDPVIVGGEWSVFPCLENLILFKCPQLTAVPSHFPALRELEIWGVDSNMPLANISGNLSTSLETLSIRSCPNLTSFIEDLRELQSLSRLEIRYCENLKCLPEGLHCLTRLDRLEIGPLCEDLHSFPNFINPDHIPQLHLPSLKHLSLHGWEKLKSLPQQLQYLTSLTFLEINDFDGMEALPEWLGDLSSLENLYIRNCENLMHLPPVEAMRRLTKLQSLNIFRCPILQGRCAKDIGSEWSKISHIPEVKFRL